MRKNKDEKVIDDIIGFDENDQPIYRQDLKKEKNTIESGFSRLKMAVPVVKNTDKDGDPDGLTYDEESGFVVEEDAADKKSNGKKDKKRSGKTRKPLHVKPRKSTKVKKVVNEVPTKTISEEDKQKKKDRILSKREQEAEHSKNSFAQDWLLFDHTIGATPIVKMKDGRYVAVVEITPINFRYRTADVKDEIIGLYAGILKTAPKKMQFITRTEKTNIKDIIKHLETNGKGDTTLANDRRKELINYVHSLSSAVTTTKKFYILFQYEAEEGEEVARTEDEIVDAMMQRIVYLREQFSRIGNSVKRHENEPLSVADLFYRELNPKSCETESIEERINRIGNDEWMLHPMDFKLDRDIEQSSYIAPRGIDFTHSDYIIKDGMYETYVFVRSNGYRNSVNAEWFERFTNFGEDVTVNLYCERRNREKTIMDSKMSAKMSRIKANEKQGKVEEANEIYGSAQNAMMIKESLQENSEDLYDVEVMLTVTQPTLKELRRKVSKIKMRLLADDYLITQTKFHMEEAAKMALPNLYISDIIKEKAGRNFLTSSLASTYHYSAYEMYDNDGIVLGVNASNGTIVAPNPYSGDRKKFPNANMIILGTAGMGKTFFLMTLAYSLRLQGKTVYVILPEKGHEWQAMTRAIGGEYIELAPASKDCINILDIRVQNDANKAYIDDDYEAGNLLSKKIQQIITFIQLNMTRGEMTDEEEASLSTVLTNLYGVYGITSDNDSIWQDKNKKIKKQMPVFGDLYKLCANDPVLSERIETIIKPYVFGNCKNLNGQTNVNFNNKFVVISTTYAGAKLAPFSFIAVDCAYDTIKADTVNQKALIMDEVWKMMINEYAAKYVMEIYKIIRGYGGAAISATQNLVDLRGNKEGSEMISNAKTKFFLGMDENDAEELSEIAQLSRDDTQTIAREGRGQALMYCGGDRLPLVIQAPGEWLPLFNTDATYKQQMKKRS